MSSSPFSTSSLRKAYIWHVLLWEVHFASSSHASLVLSWAPITCILCLSETTHLTLLAKPLVPVWLSRLPITSWTVTYMLPESHPLSAWNIMVMAWLGRDLKSWKLARFSENVQGRLLRLVKDSGTQDGLSHKAGMSTNILSLQCGLCSCPSHQMHPRQAAVCQGGGVLSTLCLFCCCFRDT